MKWGAIASVAVIVLLICLYEWPKIDRNQKKEKVAFVAIIAIGTLLAFLLIYFPDMSSPNQWIETIYKPFGKILEK